MLANSAFQRRVSSALEQRKQAGQLRTLPQLNTEAIDFCSNDYLGIAKSLHLTTASSTPALPHGSTGSRLISGNSALCAQIEQQLAAFHGSENALLYNSGYCANIGLISAIAQRGDLIILDDLAHASMHDGAKMSDAKRWRFKHNDSESLAQKLQQARATLTSNAVIYVVIESIYSMDGDAAPVKALLNTCQRYDAALIVDEAHAIGIVGARGEGVVSNLGLQNQVAATVVPCGKAPGVHGAYIACSHELRDYLINFSRAFIYSTALPPSALSALQTAHTTLANADIERQQLAQLIQYFQQRAQKSPLHAHALKSESTIQGIVFSGESAVRAAAAQLRIDGINALPIVSPTVPKGEERIRLCLHAFNTCAEIDQLWSSLEKHTASPTDG